MLAAVVVGTCSSSDGSSDKNVTKTFDRSVLPTDTVRQLLRAVLASKVNTASDSQRDNSKNRPASSGNVSSLNQQFQFSPVSGSSKPLVSAAGKGQNNSQPSVERKWSLSNLYANTRQISQDLLDIVATEKAVVD